MGSHYENVFSPMTIRGVNFKNRIELAPPSANLVDNYGNLTTEFIDFYRAFAKGGAAILHVGNCQIDALEGRDEERQPNLGSDECLLPLSRFTEMCAGFGAQASLEINHNGKDSQYDKTRKPAIAPSSFITDSERRAAAAVGRPPVPTEEMSHEKIRETVRKFADAAYRCKLAGFSVSMLHGGHGNLIP